MTSSLTLGTLAPDFTLPVDEATPFTLSKQRGKWVVLYFYPKDDTPGCTVEAKDFRDLYPEFQKFNAEVCGISRDSLASHKKFICKYELTFPLLADEQGTVCNDYGTWVEKSMYGKKYFGIQRDTFLISPEGKIQRIWHKVKVEGHAAEVLAEIQKH
jgi:peroxiredoxin Q/BCP